MVRSLPLLVVILILAVSLPAQAGLGSEALTKERHRTDFLSQYKGVSLDAVGELHRNGEVSIVTVREAADQFATRMVEIEKKSEKLKQQWERSEGESRYERQFQTASASSPIAHAGIFHLQEIYYIDSNNPTGACNGGNGGHSTVAVALPNQARDPDGDGKSDAKRWVGAAHSRISVYGSGVMVDTVTDKVQDYSTPIYYGGNSDFYCFELTVGPHTYVQNRPFVIGFVIGAGS